MPNPGNLLLIAFVLVIFGFIVGALVALFWTDRVEQKNPPASQGQPDGIDQDPSMVRLWQQGPEHSLRVKLGNQLILSSKDLSPDQVKKMELLAQEWVNWLGDHDSKTKLSQPVTRVELTNRVEQLVLNPSPITNEPTRMDFSVDPNGISDPSNKHLTDEETAFQNSGSIVRQIDRILQKMIASSDLRDRKIALTEDPIGGVTVWVGSEKFDGINSVTDPHVVSLIRSAVVEWEKRTEQLRR